MRIYDVTILECSIMVFFISTEVPLLVTVPFLLPRSSYLHYVFEECGAKSLIRSINILQLLHIVVVYLYIIFQLLYIAIIY